MEVAVSIAGPRDRLVTRRVATQRATRLSAAIPLLDVTGAGYAIQLDAPVLWTQPDPFTSMAPPSPTLGSPRAHPVQGVVGDPARLVDGHAFLDELRDDVEAHGGLVDH